MTPGWVDIHTHYDGQITWDAELAPSSVNGVTSILVGNCGVGFAPVAPDRHQFLIELLEGVEDIPGTALTEGMTWGWETFPEYLDLLDTLSWSIDVGTQIPHAALRTYVMGDRGADVEAVATPEEIATMSQLCEEAIRAGALGFTTSRTYVHRTSRGQQIGTLRAGTDEVLGIAAALRRADAGVIQLISDAYQSTDDELVANEIELLGRIATEVGRPLSFTVQQNDDAPDRFRELLAAIDRLERGRCRRQGSGRGSADRCAHRVAGNSQPVHVLPVVPATPHPHPRRAARPPSRPRDAPRPPRRARRLDSCRFRRDPALRLRPHVPARATHPTTSRHPPTASPAAPLQQAHGPTSCSTTSCSTTTAAACSTSR